MQELRAKAQSLLESGTVKVVIGFEPGTAGRPRPMLARRPEQAKSLVYNAESTSNLATYLTKREIKQMGRAAVVASAATLRSLLQLAAERQIRSEDVVALAVGADGAVRELSTVAAIEEHLATVPDTLRKDDRALLDRLAAMSFEERRAFWKAELDRCIKCYACRASCPMCYCERCTMDVNRPQWIPVASHALGNLEYHLVRAMHLAGRCVECGTCGEACPVGIPVHLLTIFAEESVRRQFGQRGGASGKPDYALTTFKPDDKESFIR